MVPVYRKDVPPRKSLDSEGVIVIAEAVAEPLTEAGAEALGETEAVVAEALGGIAEAFSLYAATSSPSPSSEDDISPHLGLRTSSSSPPRPSP